MIKNIIQTLFTKGFVKIISFLILIVSSKYLGIQTRGELSLFILNIAIIQIVNEVFTGYTLVYFVPKFNLRKLFLYGVGWVIIATTISNLILYVLNMEVLYHEWDMFFLALLITLNTFNLVILLAKERIRLYNFLSIAQPLLLLIGLAFYNLVLKRFTFEAYMYPLYISFIISFGISLVSVLRYISYGEMKKDFELRPIFENGFLCQLSVLFHLLANRLSFYFLSSTAMIGLYSNASSLIESVFIIANGISPIVLSKISNTGDSDYNRKLMLTLAKTSLVLSGVAVLALALIPNQFYIYLLGTDFAGVKSLMIWIAPGVLAVSFSSIIIHYYSGLGNLRIIAIANGIGFVFTVALAPFLIKKYELEGAAITANISYIVSALVLLVLFMKKSGFNILRIFDLRSDISNLKKAVQA
jgi:O-antigen/teichoic acid export membrane protein